MKPIRRAVHIDFHTMPGIRDFAANLSGEQIADTLAGAQVDYVNIFARCNVGFSYYPTKVGIPYPGLTFDLFGDTLRACRKRGIGVTAYINGGLHHQLLLEKPWLAKQNHEKRDPSRDHFFRTPCYRAGFLEYLEQEVAELLRYRPDGLFIDCLIPRPCLCPACLRAMQAEGVDLQDEGQLKAFAIRTVQEVIGKLRRLVPPTTRLYFNSFPFEAACEHNSHVELECLPTAFWSYDYLPAQAPYFRKLAPDKDKIYMTGRMAGDWGDFSGSKSLAAMEHDVYDAIFYGYSPSIGDLMHPRDGLDAALYRQIGQLYSYVRRMEPWTVGSTPRCEVAILRNAPSTPEVIARPLTESDRGAAQMLSELHIPYDVVNETMDLSGYRLLVLPDRINVTPTLAERLSLYRGAILSTGHSLAVGGAWSYIDAFTPDTATDAFYEYKGQVFGQGRVGVRLQSRHGLCPYVKAAFQRGFDGRHSYLYIPPDTKTEEWAVAGEGNRIHIGFCLFAAYRQTGALFYRTLLADLLSVLLPDPAITAPNLPHTARLALFSSDKGELLHLKITHPEHLGGRGIINAHHELPAGKTVLVRGCYRRVRTLPELTPVAAETVDGVTRLTLPALRGYQSFLLEP